MKKVVVLLLFLLSINCYSQGLQEIISKHRLAVGNHENVNSIHKESIMISKSITAPGQKDAINKIDDKFNDFVKSIDVKSPDKTVSNEFKIEKKVENTGDCLLKMTPIDQATIKEATNVNSNVNEFQMGIKVHLLHKIGSRAETSQNSLSTIVVNHTDEGSWISNSQGYKNKNEIHPDQLKEATLGLDLHKDFFPDLSVLTLLPRENIDNTQFYVINDSKNKIKYYIDPKTYYLIKIVNITPRKYGNDECLLEGVVIYSDFREIDGYVDAYKEETFYKTGGSLIALNYSLVTYSIIERNKKFSPEIFKMPK